LQALVQHLARLQVVTVKKDIECAAGAAAVVVDESLGESLYPGSVGMVIVMGVADEDVVFHGVGLASVVVFFTAAVPILLDSRTTVVGCVACNRSRCAQIESDASLTSLLSFFVSSSGLF